MSQSQNPTESASHSNRLSRRQFVTRTGAAALSFTIATPNMARTYAANSKVNLGIIGCGGRGTWIAKLFKAHGRAAQGSIFCRALRVAKGAGAGALIRAMMDKNKNVNMDATITLMDVPGAVEALAPLVAGGNLPPEVKPRVIAVLAMHADPAARELLRPLAADPDASIAAQATWALKRK